MAKIQGIDYTKPLIKDRYKFLPIDFGILQLSLYSLKQNNKTND